MHSGPKGNNRPQQQPVPNITWYILPMDCMEAIKYHFLNFTYKSDLSIAGADPKSVLCAFFKSGQCTKGDKCKFSHDLSVGRRAEKRSMYDDQRDDNGNQKNLMVVFRIWFSLLCYPVD